VSQAHALSARKEMRAKALQNRTRRVLDDDRHEPDSKQYRQGSRARLRPQTVFPARLIDNQDVESPESSSSSSRLCWKNESLCEVAEFFKEEPSNNVIGAELKREPSSNPILKKTGARNSAKASNIFERLVGNRIESGFGLASGAHFVILTRNTAKNAGTRKSVAEANQVFKAAYTE